MSDSATLRSGPRRWAGTGLGALYFLLQAPSTNSDSFTVMTLTIPHATLSSSIGAVAYISTPSWLGRVKEDIERVRANNPEWKSAFALAEDIMLSLDEADLRPDRVMPSSDDGVSFYFFRPDGYALITCLDSKEIIALTKEETSGHQDVWEVFPSSESMRQTVAQIRNFTTQTLNEHTSTPSGSTG